MISIFSNMQIIDKNTWKEKLDLEISQNVEHYFYAETMFKT